MAGPAGTSRAVFKFARRTLPVEQATSPRLIIQGLGGVAWLTTLMHHVDADLPRWAYFALNRDPASVEAEAKQTAGLR